MARQIVGAGECGIALAAGLGIDMLAADKIGLDVGLAMKTEVIDVLEPITALLALVALVAARMTKIDGGG